MSETAGLPVTDAKDFGDDKAAIAARWIAELQQADKETKVWHSQCRKIEQRYRDDRNTTASGDHKFNVLWSNVQTLLPAIYAKPPEPVVQRRYKDRDPVGRAAATIIERMLAYTVDCQNVHGTVKSAVLDYLLAGRGTVWLRYEPHFTEGPMPGEVAPGDDAETPEDDGVQIENEGEAEEVLSYEEVEVDYIHWEDFQHSPARTWNEVRWVARRALMTQSEGVERFGKVFRQVPLDWKPKNLTDQQSGPEYEVFKRAQVWEIWDGESRKVFWIAPAYSAEALDVRPDPLRLEGFFPCPKPLFGTLTNSTCVPVPDYVEYQDQADQLDELTGRIINIAKAVKVAGVYPASSGEIQRIFSEGVENQLIPVNDYQQFIEKGGLQAMIGLIPAEKFAVILRDLAEVRSAVKQDLYEVTGIADIIRGSTQANETATAQQLKGRYATMRLSDRQGEVARFVRDILRMMGEIICEHFNPQTLVEMSDYLFTDDAGQVASQMGHNGGPPMPSPYAPNQAPSAPTSMPMVPPNGMPPGAPMPSAGMMPPQLTAEMKVQQAIALIKDDRIRGFRVDIEDESTVIADEQADKQARMEMLTATSQFLKEAVPAGQAVPELAPVLGKMLLFGMRAFRAGRDLEQPMEDALEEMMAASKKAAQQPKPPSPDELKAQTDMAKTQADVQATQGKLQIDAQRAQAEQQAQQAEIVLKAEQQRIDAEAQERADALELQKHELEKLRLQLEMRKQDAAEHQAAQDGERADRDGALKAAQAMNADQGAADVSASADALTAMQDRLAQFGDTMQKFMEIAAKPRRIVRGPDGRAAGVEIGE